MPKLVWTDGFSVGVPLMDEQHRRLIDLINATRTSCEPAVLESMFAYAEFHFRDEETLLRDRRYPELDRQVAEHARFIDQTRSFAKKDLRDPEISRQLNRFLCSWLSYHILEIDMRYKHFLLPVKP